MDKIWSLFSGNYNILKFLLSPVRFTKCLGVRVPLRPPRKTPWFRHNNWVMWEQLGLLTPRRSENKMGHARDITVTRAKSGVLNRHLQGAHWETADKRYVMRELQCSCCTDRSLSEYYKCWFMLDTKTFSSHYRNKHPKTFFAVVTHYTTSSPSSLIRLLMIP
jgi:hypothetical protein